MEPKDWGQGAVLATKKTKQTGEVQKHKNNSPMDPGLLQTFETPRCTH